MLAGSALTTELHELLRYLTPRELDELESLAANQLGPAFDKYIPQAPTSRQLEFLDLTCREALYGGAAGGGKSSALLMAALLHVDKPGYAAILFRRTFTDLSLPDALIPRSHDWLAGTDATWDGNEYRWTFPSGATLSFGYLKAEKDKYRYQGAAFQFIGWDELTQFEETQYRYLFSRLRRLEGVDIPLRVRGASNPGGSGHEWVKQRFGLPEGDPTRPFIPARVDDNPYLDRDEYIASLSELDPITRAQLLAGDWSVRSTGGLFRREWFTTWDGWPVYIPRVRYWDLASTEPSDQNPDPDWTAGALLGRQDTGTIWVLDMRRVRSTPLGVKQLVRQTAEQDGRGVAICIEQEPGASGKALIDSYIRELQGYEVRGVRPTGDKITRARPMSSYAEAGNMRLLRGPWIGDFMDELEAFPQGAHDDQVDAASGAFAQLAPGSGMTIHEY